MSRHFWADIPEVFTLEGPMNTDEAAAFAATTSSVIAGPGTLTYNLPEGYQVAGEGFEHAVGEGDTLYYQPALKAVTRTWGAVTDGWSMIPCVIRLTMDTFEQVDVIDLTPSIPTITNYRDASLRSGEPHFVDGLDNVPDCCAWGRVADCGSGAEVSTTGNFHGVLRVGDWLIPRFSNANQCYAYNLATETYWRLEGWDDMPAQLLQADVSDGLDFLAYDHTRSWYNVLTHIGDSKVLLLREVQDREVSVVSDFTGSLTPEATVAGETVQDYFARKWVNASGTSSVVWSGPDTEDWYDKAAFNWDSPDIQAGSLPGEPFGIGNGVGPFLDVPGNVRSKGDLQTEFTDAIQTDLDDIVTRPKYNGIKTTAATMELQVWDFSSTTTPAYVETLYTWDDETVDGGPLLRGQSEYTMTATTMGALPMRDAEGEYEEDNYVIDVSTDVDYYRRTDSSFTLGAGVMVHGLLPTNLGSSGSRWLVKSEDINNAPGPQGPALFKVELDDPGDPRYSQDCYLTVVETPIVANPLLPAQPEWHPGNVVSAGTVAIFLPRLSRAGLIRCLPLTETAPDWTVDPLDHVDFDLEEATHGATIANGVLTAQFLYVVIQRDGTPTDGQSVLKIRVYDLLNEEEEVVEAAGTVASVTSLDQLIFADADLYRDNLLVVNRRLVGLDATTFFEIS